MSEYKWRDVPGPNGYMRRSLYACKLRTRQGDYYADTPYFVDKVTGPVQGIWFCLYGPQPTSVFMDVVVLGWFHLLREAKAEAERLAEE